MKNFFLLLACMAVCGSFARAQQPLKLMTYNIRNANGLDNVRNYQRIANVIVNAAPDVVAIQETDSMTARSENRYVLGEIAERTQMKAFFAPAIEYDGGKYGIGLLSRQTPLQIRTLPLPGREEKRTLLLAEFEDFVYCCVHLSLTEEDRMESLRVLTEVASGYDKPFFLAGDMNDEPGSRFTAELQKNFRLLSNPKHFTFPASAPDRTIDYIAVAKKSDKGFVCLSSKVVDEPVASDHRPVQVELRMAVKAEKIFRTKPYLQNPTDGGMTVMWETNVPTYSWVEYGTDTTQLQRVRTLINGQTLCNNLMHKIRIDGLQPGQKYYYRLCSQEMLLYKAYQKAFGNTARSPFYEFTLPDPAGDSFTALVFNDLHQRGETFRALCAQVSDVSPDFVVFNGDCIDDPASHEQATYFISELTKGIHGSRVPAFYIRGNHEIRNAYSVGLRDHFDYVGGKTYGAFNWGDTRIVMLDCGEDKEDTHPEYSGLNDFTELRHEQVDFLKQELSSKAFKKANKRILLHHIPLYGCNKNLCADLWMPLLEKAPFDICINAHTHRYAYHPKGELGNNFPVVIGGGYQMDSATEMVLEKRKDSLRIRVLNTKGKVLLDVEL